MTASKVHTLRRSMLEPLRQHGPEYVLEGLELGCFMLSACVFGTLLFHPDSPLAARFSHPLVQRGAMGLAMGATAVALIHSPWGRRSGAHLNPAVTLTFWRLGKIKSADAMYYVASQFIGGVAGVLMARLLLRESVTHPTVNYVVTVPGPSLGVAFLTEILMAAGIMTLVLVATNTPRLAPRTGILVGVVVASYITFLAPLSGMSINPARSFGSAAVAQVWTAFWIYLVAPPLGMLAAAARGTRVRQRRPVICAKLVHDRTSRCIFAHCGYAAEHAPAPPAQSEAPAEAPEARVAPTSEAPATVLSGNWRDPAAR